MRKRTLLAATGVTTLALAVGIVGGAAVAQVPTLRSPAGITAEPGVESEPIPAPTYERNAGGLTFGSAADAPSPDQEPQLILAQATNGKEGYVKKSELDEANGSAAAAEFSSPEEALKWQASLINEVVKIPVYDVDAKTVIGEFEVGDSSESR